MKKLDPHSLLRRMASAISGTGGCVRKEVGPGGFGFPGAKEEASAGQDNKWVARRTKRGGAQGWWSVEWPEGCGQWLLDCTALAELGFTRCLPLWVSLLFCRRVV